MLKKLVDETQTSITGPDWPAWTGSNHDQPRFPSRWAKGDERKIRCILTFLIALRGTPVLYYGDELGMQNTYVAPWRLKDPVGKRFWPVYAGRDRARTPMPWRNRKGAGFTEPNVRPWLPYGDLSQRNVASQRARKDSTWQFTRDLIALRKRLTDLSIGGYEPIETVSSVWAWRRGNLVVAINLSRFHHELTEYKGEIVLCSDRKREGERVAQILHLKPWEAVILQP